MNEKLRQIAEMRRILLSSEAARALRALVAADNTGADENALVSRLVLEEWQELDEGYREGDHGDG